MRRGVVSGRPWRVWVASLIGFAAGITICSADLYWVGTGTWSTAANWALTSGGSGGAGVPGDGTNVFFDANGGPSTNDAASSATIQSLTLTSAYTGTNTQNRNLTVSGDCLFYGGAWRFTAGTAADLTIGTNMVVSNATVYCQYASIGGEGTGRVFAIGGNLMVATNGSFNAKGLGFRYNQGPNASGSVNVSGSHGGDGGAREGKTFGSITHPVSLGGGGYNTYWGPRDGGGAISLLVTGATMLASGSLITVDSSETCIGGSGGTQVTATASGGGGGSAFIKTATLTGNGTVSARGGTTTDSSSWGGGGGRIAIWLTSETSFDGITCVANGGTGSSVDNGAAGTVYLQTSVHPEGQGVLIVNNNSQLPRIATTMMTPGTDMNGFSQIIVTNCGNIGIRTNVNFGQANFVGSGVASAFVTIRNPAVGLTYPTNITGNYTLNIDVPVTFPGNLTIAMNGCLSHTANGDTKTYWMDVTVASNLTVKGQINVIGRGYGNGGGPGRSTLKMSGAGHGGCGGGYVDTNNGVAYGSITNPTTLGSGGPGTPWAAMGGGAVILTVRGVLTVDAGAVISGDAYYIPSGNGRGAGGTINIRCASLAGSGSILANGGPSGDGCGGGGGRIAIVLTNDTAFGSVTIRALGGKRGDTYTNGAAGTIYLKKASDTYGTLIINTTNAGPTAATLISSNVTGAIVGDVIITNSAWLALGSNQTLVVYGNWLNYGTFTAATNSSVIFAGSGQVTLLGNNTFHNFYSTVPGRTFVFEAGKTNTVQGGLVIRDATLNSTVNNQYWYLTLAPGGTQDMRRITVRDSNASLGQQILARSASWSSGHNVNWQFLGGTVILLQ